MSKEPSYLSHLNGKQKEAVEHGKEPLLILAGAGSGKTRVITTRIAYLIDVLHYDPRSILAVTFTNKAAREMKERVESLVGEQAEVMIKTFHSFGAWFLRRNAAAAGLKSRFTIYDDTDSFSLLKTIAKGLPRNEIKGYASLISKAKDYCLTPDDDLNKLDYSRHLAGIYSQYQAKIEEIGNVDFGDLIMRPVQVLERNPEIRNRFQQRFKIILVDEYQDSNIAQHLLLKNLCGPETMICVVGDDDQSIYKFRGAEIKNILNFEKTYKDTKIIKLEQNYRSSGNILKIASAVVANNSNRLGKTLWTDKPEGKKAVIAYLEDQNSEVVYCHKLLKDKNYAGTAILYRTNAQSRAFESYFLRHKIPYRLVGTLGFYNREEIKDILSYLAFFQNTGDEVAFRRIINKPSRGIGAKSVEKIISCSGNNQGDLLKACQEASSLLKGKAASGISVFMEGYANFFKKLSADIPLSSLVQMVAQDTGIIEYYEAKDHENATSKTANIKELVSAAVDYPSTEEGLGEFLELIELDQEQIAENEKKNDTGVTLITIHNTKGLEFDRVILTGMEEGLFPKIMEDEDSQEALEEERRLFYVGITRARKELYFTSCFRRLIYGRYNANRPSPFLSEIPSSSITIEGKNPTRLKSDYPVGTSVYHNDYGAGQVVKQWYSEDSKEVVIVQFESGRSSRFIPSFSALEKLSSDEWM